MKTRKRKELVLSISGIVMVALVLVALFFLKPWQAWHGPFPGEPVRQSPLSEAPRTEIVQERTGTIIIVKPHQDCIFNEGIEGCRYNDRLGRKEGPAAYKRYDMSEVLRKAAR